MSMLSKDVRLALHKLAWNSRSAEGLEWAGLKVDLERDGIDVSKHAPKELMDEYNKALRNPGMNANESNPLDISGSSGSHINQSILESEKPHSAENELSAGPSRSERSKHIDGAQYQVTMESILEDDYDLNEKLLSQEKWGVFRCEHPSCWDRNDKFRFHVFADLARHYKDVHPPIIENESFPCDYSTCKRADDIFSRKDAYRDHLRENHLEDMPKRHKSAKREQEWLASRVVSSAWWRCARCLLRVDTDRNGWKCNGCEQFCETERRSLREDLWRPHVLFADKQQPISILSTEEGKGIARQEERALTRQKSVYEKQGSPLETLAFLEKGLQPLVPESCNSFAFAHIEYPNHKAVPFISIKQLGHGSLGSVDAVREKGNGGASVLARKVIRIPNMARKRLLPLIQQEVEVLRGLSHKHIVQVVSTYETTSVPRQFGILISPAGDEDLSHYLERVGECEFPIEDVQRLEKWQYCLASAVNYIHSRNIRHKDIKPSNAICKGEDIFLTDFGSAHQFSAGLTSSTEGYALGVTKMYSAPEVVDEDRRGRSADIYSLGCVFAEMVTVINRATVEEFHEFRSEPIPDEPERTNLCYYATSHKIEEWFVIHGDKNNFRLISKMMAHDQNLRPSAKNVLMMLEERTGHNRCDCYDGPEATPEALSTPTNLLST
ncbi:hypothetical protein G7Y89_g6629 [Cudoniella acicularis]|uniref:non-specific serine/threonine protein kinase n=1 Tax=Cudoniella acicularis TaxID=354080 RepID=A0A8H4W2N7_9HELO|nr:hypothetical protein G7Y89_g6629 [Cudoniella acicularis]